MIKVVDFSTLRRAKAWPRNMDGTFCCCSPDLVYLVLVVLVLSIFSDTFCYLPCCCVAFDVCCLFAGYCFCCGCGRLVMCGSLLLLVPVIVLVIVVIFVLVVVGVVVIVKPSFLKSTNAREPCTVHCWIDTIPRKLILPQFLAKQPSTFECIT